MSTLPPEGPQQHDARQRLLARLRASAVEDEWRYQKWTSRSFDGGEGDKSLRVRKTLDLDMRLGDVVLVPKGEGQAPMPFEIMEFVWPEDKDPLLRGCFLTKLHQTGDVSIVEERTGKVWEFYGHDSNRWVLSVQEAIVDVESAKVVGIITSHFSHPRSRVRCLKTDTVPLTGVSEADDDVMTVERYRALKDSA